MCTLHALLVQYPSRLTPSFHGSMARCLDCSDLLRRSTPLRTASRSLRPSPVRPLLSSPLGVHLFVFSFTCYTMPCLTWFVCSFLRSFVLLLPRAARCFGDFNARQLLFSRLLSPSLSVSFRSSVPAPTRVRIPARSSLFRGSVPSPFQSGAFPRLTGIFGAAPFGIDSSSSLSLSNTLSGYVASLSSVIVFFFQIVRRKMFRKLITIYN